MHHHDEIRGCVRVCLHVKSENEEESRTIEMNEFIE